MWATPYELIHGEAYPDSSIVVPFGCAVLVLLEKEDRENFETTCAMMIFVHYAQDHPLYLSALFSPDKNDSIQIRLHFPDGFPMRMAKTKGRHTSDGSPWSRTDQDLFGGRRRK